MTQRIQETTEFISALSDYWNEHIQPEVLPNACILASRYATEVLSYFDIHNTVVSASVHACNDIMLDFMLTTGGTPPFPDDAWSVGVGIPNASAQIKPSGTGWDGHAVVLTRSFFIDLTAPQLDRPQYDIVTGGSIVMPLSEIKTSPLSDKWGYIKLPSGHYSWTTTGDARYKSTKDWRSTYKLFTGDAIRSLKKNFGHLLHY